MSHDCNNNEHEVNIYSDISLHDYGSLSTKNNYTAHNNRICYSMRYGRHVFLNFANKYI